MITDSEGELPWFAEGDLIIAPPASVRAQIHIKTEFGVGELTDVMSSGAQNHHVWSTVATPYPLWFGAVFFAKTKLKAEGDLQYIWRNAISKASKRKRKDPKIFPDCVAIIGGPILLVDKNDLSNHTVMGMGDGSLEIGDAGYRVGYRRPFTEPCCSWPGWLISFYRTSL
jgi:hypothetical protein